MGRRAALWLFAALALLVAPTTATALSPSGTTDVSSAARITLTGRHATGVHAVVPSRGGHERRAPDHSGSSLAVLGGSLGDAPACAWARLTSAASSPAAALRASSRPRAPPAVV